MANATKYDVLRRYKDALLKVAALEFKCQEYTSDFPPASEELEAAENAVFARMAGPGEVVVPKEPTYHDLLAMSIASGASLGQLTKAWRVFIAARPNNGGTDDQGK